MAIQAEKTGNSLQILNGTLTLRPYNRVTGLYGNKIPFGGTDSISHTDTTERIEHSGSEAFSTVRYVDDSDVISTNSTITVTTRNITNHTLAKASLANITEVVQAESLAEAQTHTAVELGTIISVDAYNVSNLIVKDATDLITYVAGTDYIEFPEFGEIELLESGTIVGGTDLHIIVDIPALNLTEGIAFSNTSERYELTYMGSGATGKKMRRVYPMVEIYPSGSQELKAETSAYSSLTFEIKAFKHDGKAIYKDTVFS